jgi:hypothetical protein
VKFSISKLLVQILLIVTILSCGGGETKYVKAIVLEVKKEAKADSPTIFLLPPGTKVSVKKTDQVVKGSDFWYEVKEVGGFVPGFALSEQDENMKDGKPQKMLFMSINQHGECYHCPFADNYIGLYNNKTKEMWREDSYEDGLAELMSRGEYQVKEGKLILKTIDSITGRGYFRQGLPPSISYSKSEDSKDAVYIFKSEFNGFFFEGSLDVINNPKYIYNAKEKNFSPIEQSAERIGYYYEKNLKPEQLKLDKKFTLPLEVDGMKMKDFYAY